MAAEVSFAEELHDPSELNADDEQGIIDILGGVKRVFGDYHVYRLGHTLAVGTAEQPLHTTSIRFISPADAEYAEMAAEGRESGQPPHHPV